MFSYIDPGAHHGLLGRGHLGVSLEDFRELSIGDIAPVVAVGPYLIIIFLPAGQVLIAEGAHLWVDIHDSLVFPIIGGGTEDLVTGNARLPIPRDIDAALGGDPAFHAGYPLGCGPNGGRKNGE